MKLFFSLSILLFTHSLFGQTKQIAVYFDIDSYELTSKEIKKLDILAKPENGEYIILKLESFTDYSGSKEYNKILSKHRSESVLQLLEDFTPPAKINNIGEEYKTDNYSAEKYRRVDIYYDTWIDGPEMDVATKPNFPRTNQVAPIETVSTGLTVDFQEFMLDNSAKEATIVLSILFHGDSDAFINPDDPDLWALFDVLKTNDNLSVEIRGHVCCGSNFPLSTSRSYAVYKFMTNRGISPNRMKYKGYDNTIPAVSPELTAIDRSKNRRVDVVFQKQ